MPKFGSDKPSPAACASQLAAVGDALYVIGGKWKLRIIIALADGCTRFNELQRTVAGISARVLSNELKDLEMNGFVQRTVHVQTPVIVEYELTEYSHTLEKVLQSLSEWGTMHRAHIQQRGRENSTSSLENKIMEHPPIILERVFNAPTDKVWKALTDKNEMKNWYFQLAEFKAEPGFPFQFLGGKTGGQQYLHLCEVTEVVPEKKLTYSWRYDGFAGISYVTFELIAQEDKTLLKLTHRGLESFPQENPDFAVGNFVDGWNQLIHTSLRKYLEGNA